MHVLYNDCDTTIAKYDSIMRRIIVPQYYVYQPLLCMIHKD
jgi:hypothetical protein